MNVDFAAVEKFSERQRYYRTVCDVSDGGLAYLDGLCVRRRGDMIKLELAFDGSSFAILGCVAHASSDGRVGVQILATDWARWSRLVARCSAATQAAA